MTLLLTTSLVVLGVLTVVGFGPALARPVGPASRRRAADPPPPVYDPGRERRAEVRARELLRSVVSAPEYAMYAELGFIAVNGSSGERGYAYLLYPHRPIVAYDTHTGELLSEYCVAFPDRSEPAAEPAAPRCRRRARQVDVAARRGARVDLGGEHARARAPGRPRPGAARSDPVA